MIRTTCNRCGGENISQAASIWIDLSDRTHAVDREDLQWEDHFYCRDCEDEVTVTEAKQ